MKLTYLGTAAAEGFPAIFCNCSYCKEARKLGGRNIRTRSQSLINDDLLIDLPADTYSHFLQNEIEGDKIKYLFITHSHSDHLYPMDLGMRHGVYAHDMRTPVLNIYCSQGAYEKINLMCKKQEGYQVNLIKPYEKIVVDGYEVIPLPARHFQGDGAVIYIIKGDKTILYAHDTGFLYDEVLDYIEKEKIYFDMISLDCTHVNLPVSDSGGHMGIENNERLVKKLVDIAAVDENTIKYINHFSHNGNPLHHLLEKQVESMDFKVAYDGLQVLI